jgi:preprotein translocase subunit SecA
MSEQVRLWIDEVVEDTVNTFTEEPYPEEWDLEALTNAMAQLYQTEITAAELREDMKEISRDSLMEEFQTDARDEYAAKEEEFGAELMRELERFVILQVVDVRWREHLEHMDYLREGIGLRAMAQKDPLVEYTGEGEVMFTELSRSIRGEVVLHLFHAEIAPEQGAGGGPVPPPAPPQGPTGNGNVQYEHESVNALGLSPVAVQTSAPHKVGRNDPCWCGSGKKFKKCHGA